eukprot:SAG31_NODE_1543_length_7944_cov_8.711281_7_plen_85_part_00
MRLLRLYFARHIVYNTRQALAMQMTCQDRDVRPPESVDQDMWPHGENLFRGMPPQGSHRGDPTDIDLLVTKRHSASRLVVVSPQ